MAIKLDYGDINPYREEEAKAKQGGGGNVLYQNQVAPMPPSMPSGGGAGGVNDLLHSLLDTGMRKYMDANPGQQGFATRWLKDKGGDLLKGSGKFASSIADFASDKFGDAKEGITEGIGNIKQKRADKKAEKVKQAGLDEFYDFQSALEEAEDLGWDDEYLNTLRFKKGAKAHGGTRVDADTWDKEGGRELIDAMKGRAEALKIPWLKRDVDSGKTHYTSEEYDEINDPALGHIVDKYGAMPHDPTLGGFSSDKYGRYIKGSASGSGKDYQDKKRNTAISQKEWDKKSILQKAKKWLSTDPEDAMIIPESEPTRPSIPVDSDTWPDMDSPNIPDGPLSSDPKDIASWEKSKRYSNQKARRATDKVVRAQQKAQAKKDAAKNKKRINDNAQKKKLLAAAKEAEKKRKEEKKRLEEERKRLAKLSGSTLRPMVPWSANPDNWPH